MQRLQPSTTYRASTCSWWGVKAKFLWIRFRSLDPFCFHSTSCWWFSGYALVDECPATGANFQQRISPRKHISLSFPPCVALAPSALGGGMVTWQGRGERAVCDSAMCTVISLILRKPCLIRILYICVYIYILKESSDNHNDIDSNDE